MAAKVFELGTVWTSLAKVKYIDDSGSVLKWVTVASCIDTPVAIAKAVAKAKKSNPGKVLWLFNLDGKKIL